MLLSRRRFSACAICVALGELAASGASAQSPAGAPAGTPGVTRTVVTQTDLPDGKFVAIAVHAEIAANATVARHTHPGVESAYVIDGEGELMIDGQASKKLGANDSFQVPPERPHSLKNGAKPMKLAITYVVEKGKPIATPAPG
jgi:quercetin dioxygenase-like cupin family protein